MLSGRGSIQQALSCAWVGSVQEYPRELQTDGLISCDMIGVAPGDETLALPGGDPGTATITAMDACCRCGGGEYIDGGAENGGEGISVKTTVLEVPEAGCQNGNVPVQLGDYLVGQIDELEGL